MLVVLPRLSRQAAPVIDDSIRAALHHRVWRTESGRHACHERRGGRTHAAGGPGQSTSNARPLGASLEGGGMCDTTTTTTTTTTTHPPPTCRRLEMRGSHARGGRPGRPLGWAACGMSAPRAFGEVGGHLGQ